MGDLPESVASGSNTFAPKSGSAGAYEADTLWSAGLATDFSTGVGHSLSDNGIYYAEVDTRRPDVVLPALARYGVLRDRDLSTEDTSPLAGRCAFAEAGDRLFCAQGNALYEWQEQTQAFIYKLYLGMYATSMAYFDGYLHIAGYREGDEPTRDYLWVRIDSMAYGFDTNSITRPQLFHVFGGILYAAQENELYYTAGGTSESQAPWQWEWTGPIKVGGYGDPINGVAGLIYQQLGQRYVYVSTRSQLLVVLPGDIPFGITSWPMTDERNGVGMRTFYNRIYIPVGGDLMTLQANGDLIAAGVDNNAEGLPYAVSGDHFDLATSASMPFVTIRSSHGYDTIWAGKASSWHYAGRLPADQEVAGSHYSSVYGRLFVGTLSGMMVQWYMGNTSRSPQYDLAYRYAESGAIDTGWYAGSLFEQHKYWHSVFVDAEIAEGTSIELRYLADDEDAANDRNTDYATWTLLGQISHDVQEIPLNYTVSSQRLRVAAILKTEHPTKTPTVRSLGVRYAPKLLNRRRWAITVKLPKWELYDAETAKVEDYSQAVWDEHLNGLHKRETPVRFRDLDGREYWVLVTGASRRIHSVGVDDGAITYDIDWSFALTEVGSDENRVSPHEV